MLSITIEKQRKPSPSLEFCLTEGWGGSRRAEGPDLSNGSIFLVCLFLLLQMLPNSIEKQRTRLPFFKLCLAKEMPPIFEILFGGRLCGYYILMITVPKNRNRLQEYLCLLFGMLAISIERQRKRPPFLKSCLAARWARGGRPGPD